MDTFDFDEIIDRRHTGSYKWDLKTMKSVLPMWVADMDFKAPNCALDAMQAEIERGVFGYALAPDKFYDILIERMKRLYDWDIKAEWIVWLPGLETSFTVASRAVCYPEDAVMTFTPIYPPFTVGPALVERELQTIAWASDGNGWYLDFDKIESNITPQTKLILLCNPHNPIGRAYRRDELLKLADLCLKYDIVMLSDEVHCDLILDDIEHIPFSTLSSEIQEKTITLMAPSKTFNIAGLGCGFGIIPNRKIRQRFQNCMRGTISMLSPMSFAAGMAVYEGGEPWRLALLDYLRDNRQLLLDAINDSSNGLSMISPEATYLAWIKCDKAIEGSPAAKFKSHGLGLSPGYTFGDDRYVRLNFGCPRSTLEEGIRRIKKAL